MEAAVLMPFEGTIMMDDTDPRAHWRELYRLLQDLMQVRGSESYLGDADFWIVDDFSEDEQKIIISNPDLFCSELAHQLQSLLKGRFSDWRIFLQYESMASGECLPLMIDKHGIGRLFEIDELEPEIPADWHFMLSLPRAHF